MLNENTGKRLDRFLKGIPSCDFSNSVFRQLNTSGRGGWQEVSRQDAGFLLKYNSLYAALCFLPCSRAFKMLVEVHRLRYFAVMDFFSGSLPCFVILSQFSSSNFSLLSRKIPESVCYKFGLTYELITSRITLQDRILKGVVEKCGNCVNSLR